MIDYSETIKMYRKRAGLSQRALSRLAVMPHNTVHYYEAHTREPEFGSFVRIIEALGGRVQVVFPRKKPPAH